MKRMTASAKEHRLTGLFQTFGKNLKEYGHDLGTTYISEPVKSKDPVQMVMGGVGAAASVVLEGTDAIWSGIVDEDLERPSGLIGRTRRDAGLLLKNVVTLHPLKALGNGWRLLTSDLPMDAIDAVGGFHQDERQSSREVSGRMAA